MTEGSALFGIFIQKEIQEEIQKYNISYSHFLIILHGKGFAYLVFFP